VSNREETDFERLLEEARAEGHRAALELKQLCADVNAEHLFAAVFAHLVLVPAGVANEITHSAGPIKIELLAYHLIPCFGSCAPGEPIDVFHISRALGALDTLFAARQRESMFAKLHQSRSSDPDARHLDDLLWSVRLDAETVRGSAYPEQIAREIKATLGRFDEWFDRRVGVSPGRAASALLAIISAHEAKATSWFPELIEASKSIRECFLAARNKKARLTDEDRFVLRTFRKPSHAGSFGYSTRLAELAVDLPATAESIHMEPPMTETEWKGLCNLLGCSLDVRARMAEPVEMIRFPLITLTGGKVLCGEISNALDQLRDRFEEIAAQDASYANRYREWRGEWHQHEVARCFRRIFPADAVYESLTYPDPDKPSGHTAELDTAVWWEPFLILVEAKSGQFRLESQLGDVGRLRTDLKKNVADAFDQAQRAARQVQSREESQFVERSTGRKLAIRKRDIQRTFLVTASLRLLANVATYLAWVNPLHLFAPGEYPWSVSLADLETVAEFCEGPDVFLHYIERRLAAQLADTETVGDEIRLFGAYLKTRLPESIFFDDQGRQLSMISFADFHLKFDEMMEFRRGERKEAPIIRLELPPRISAVLAELRARQNDPSSRWIAHSLLSLSNDQLKALNDIISTARQRLPRPGHFGRGVYCEGGIAICVVTGSDSPSWVLRERAKRVAIIEKHRRRVDKTVCFAIDLRETQRPFLTALWLQGEWAPDRELDRLVAEDSPIPVGKLPAVNDPGFCGSGKKFKKCCRRRLDVRREDAGPGKTGTMRDQ
jgi:hypothetical protein